MSLYYLLVYAVRVFIACTAKFKIVLCVLIIITTKLVGYATMHIYGIINTDLSQCAYIFREPSRKINGV